MEEVEKEEIEPLSNEELAKAFQEFQDSYFETVDSYFSQNNKSRGIFAFESWERRFITFLSLQTPSLFQLYSQTIQSKSYTSYYLATVYESWKSSKGNDIVAFLSQAFDDARAGRLERSYQASKSSGKTNDNAFLGKKVNTTNKIFIGHGRSNVWKELKDFLADRLQLDWDEFNREPSAGKSTTARIQEMLNQASFAFIVMTAEDEHLDGTVHPRENVIHEAGLFQGKLGFEKAILLVEEGCHEFSNIHGLTQIRFSKNDILSKSEEIRKVLEREKIIKTQ